MIHPEPSGPVPVPLAGLPCDPCASPEVAAHGAAYPHRVVHLQRGEVLRAQFPGGAVTVRMDGADPHVTFSRFMHPGGPERVFALCPTCPDRRACGGAGECLAGTKAGTFRPFGGDPRCGGVFQPHGADAPAVGP